MKWFGRKKKNKRQADYMRPVRIANRLQLRINDLSDDAKTFAREEKFEESDALAHRIEVLLKRMRRVRDIQIRDWGH